MSLSDACGILSKVTAAFAPVNKQKDFVEILKITKILVTAVKNSNLKNVNKYFFQKKCLPSIS